jgi:AraC-like DNA-binding protein
MARNSNIFAETTGNNKKIDSISDLLRSMQVSGCLLLNECYASPWAITIPSQNILAEKLTAKRNTHVAAFHFVQQGFIDIELENGARDRAYEGDIVICYSGHAHTIYQGSNTNKISFETMMDSGKNIFTPAVGSELQSTLLLCGVFQLQNTVRNPLFEALPPILKLSTSPAEQYAYSAIKTIINLLLDELAHPSYSHEYVVGRYLELLCANSINSYVESNNLNNGWLHAIKNPMVARVFNAIHAHPEYAWSVANMAKLSNLSPSRFAARFTQILGMSPMSYVTQWRMYMAGQMLILPQSNIEQITTKIGYENVAAFSRAFKRTMGFSPGEWRTNNQVHSDA